MTVDGTSNRTRFSIDAAWGARSPDNTVIDKDGDTNYFTGSIEGSGNTVDITQHGTTTELVLSWYTKDGVSVVGDYNTATITQMGNSHHASIMQTGNSNTATITQSN